MADKKQTMLYGLLTSIASKITYDNTESGLTADNVQDAIDELASSSMKSEDITDEITLLKFDPTYIGKTLVVQRIGKIVSVDINQTLSVSLSAAEDAVAEGFPLPKDYVYFLGSNGAMNGQAIRGCINPSGQFCSSWNNANLVTQGSAMQFHFFYLTKED